MPRENSQLLAFNRGLVSPLALGRIDLKRLALSAEEMVNWMPRVLGSMMLRPGFGYVGNTRSNLAARFLDFVFSTDDTALLELTNLTLRVWRDDALVTRGTVSSAVTNGNFDTNLTGWTDNDEGTAASVWVAGGYMGLTGTGSAAAIRDQSVTVAAPDQGDEHALRIIIQRGPVILRVGSSAGADDYVDDTMLETGTHSLTFTPTGNFNIRFMSRLTRQVLVDSCQVEGAGVLTLPTPWLADDLGLIRKDQSGDKVFLACDGYQQKVIERRNPTSWSVVRYASEDGPFRNENITPVTLAASALSGNITLAASAMLFKSTQVGALYRSRSSSQKVEANISAQNTFTNAIKVFGNSLDSRNFNWVISGTFVANVTIQQSTTSDTGPWVDFLGPFTAPTTGTDRDALLGQDVWYRIGVKTGDYTSGTAHVELTFPGGGIIGIARVTGFTSATIVSAEVLQDFGSTDATDEWAEGEWSDFRGYPTSVALYEGRLWWAGRDKVWGSISDDFGSFDPDFEGDAGPINRSIGSGPVDFINWLLPLQRLMLGTEGAEISCRSTSFDEPLSPTNFNLKAVSTQGSAPVSTVKVDNRGYYIQRGGTRIFEVLFAENFDYGTEDQTLIVPEIGQPSIVRMGIQRQPDTRLHCVRSDGTVAVLVSDRVEEVKCWLELETTGFVEDVVVLPGDNGTSEDQVYYVVRRTINGSTVRFLERWALESECQGETLNKQADAFAVYSGVATTTPSGFSHLNGATVVAWADGVPLSGTFTVSAGAITLTTAASNVVAGLAYTAQWKSAKLAYAAGQGTALLQRKNIPQVGLLLYNTHQSGIKYGRSFDILDDLPGVVAGAEVAENQMWSSYDEQPFALPGEWDTDARLCLQAAAPKPCTVLAAVLTVQTNDNV